MSPPSPAPPKAAPSTLHDTGPGAGGALPYHRPLPRPRLPKSNESHQQGASQLCQSRPRRNSGRNRANLPVCPRRCRSSRSSCGSPLPSRLESSSRRPYAGTNSRTRTCSCHWPCAHRHRVELVVYHGLDSHHWPPLAGFWCSGTRHEVVFSGRPQKTAQPRD